MLIQLDRSNKNKNACVRIGCLAQPLPPLTQTFKMNFSPEMQYITEKAVILFNEKTQVEIDAFMMRESVKKRKNFAEERPLALGYEQL